MSQSVHRFSSRVENYRKYRPGYPTEVVELLRQECGLSKNAVIADVGSGTGKLSEIFLDNGNQVLAVEPNPTMRAAAETIFGDLTTFVSIDGTAEATKLSSNSVDFVTAGQAFHWFDSEKFRAECLRILKPLGWAVLIWNDRRLDSTPFLKDYEALLLRYSTDYQTVRHGNAAEAIEKFFAPHLPHQASFYNSQAFDLEGLRGRVFSSSYTPEPGHPNFQPMLEELDAVFQKHKRFGQVSFEYDTKVFYDRLRGTK